MFRASHKLKFLTTVLSFFFVVGTFLVSTHVHINSRNGQNEIACPLCQFARTTVKFLVDHKVPDVEPSVVTIRLLGAHGFIITQDIILFSPIRGPPLV